MIIGAGWEQESLILEAKRLGHFVVATHPQLNTTGLSHADVFFVKDSLDIASHMQIAKTYNVDGMDYIVTANEGDAREYEYEKDGDDELSFIDETTINNINIRRKFMNCFQSIQIKNYL